MKLTIQQLLPGDRVRLIDFGKTAPAYRRKLLSFGLTRGVELSVVRIAPLGCPIQFNVRGSAVALRKDEAVHLVWERV